MNTCLPQLDYSLSKCDHGNSGGGEVKFTGIPVHGIACPRLPGHSAHLGEDWPSESLRSFGILEAPFCELSYDPPSTSEILIGPRLRI